MNITMKNFAITGNGFKKKGGTYELDGMAKVDFADGLGNAWEIILRDGFRTDGLSVPWIFRWFLPKWDNDNVAYSLAGAVRGQKKDIEELKKRVDDYDALKLSESLARIQTDLEWIKRKLEEE